METHGPRQSEGRASSAQWPSIGEMRDLMRRAPDVLTRKLLLRANEAWNDRRDAYARMLLGRARAVIAQATGA